MSLRSCFRIRDLSRKLMRTARIMPPTIFALAVAGATNVAQGNV